MTSNIMGNFQLLWTAKGNLHCGQFADPKLVVFANKSISSLAACSLSNCDNKQIVIISLDVIKLECVTTTSDNNNAIR